MASPDRRAPVHGPAEARAAEISHGLALAATAFLAGLAPFVALVWLPANGQSGVGRAAIRPLGALAWGLLVALAVAGAGELYSYAARASGGALSAELFSQALLDSRVGAVWLGRLGLALLVAASITAAARSGRAWPWWAATGAGAVLLTNPDRAEPRRRDGAPLAPAGRLDPRGGRGGLDGRPARFRRRPVLRTLRGLAPDLQAKVRERSVRRFSSVATTAVAVLACTGLYAASSTSRARRRWSPRPTAAPF
jgi:putative copper export protein